MSKDDPIATTRPTASVDRYRRLVANMRARYDEERAAIHHRLHDDVGQSLTSIKIEAARLAESLSKVRPDEADKLSSIEKQVDGLLSSIQEIMALCRPAIPRNLELSDVIEWRTREFEVRTGIACTVSTGSIPAGIEEGIASAIVQILGEALDNVKRHANATEATISLRRDKEELVLVVEDNGQGITTDEVNASDSIGLFQINELALGKRGRLVLNGIPGRGTTLEAVIPLQAALRGKEKTQ